MKEIQLSVVIPAYNEKNGVVPTLREVLSLLGEGGLAAEIVVVDDGSTDGTGERIEAFLAEDAAARDAVKLVRHKKNRGYGASLKTGINAASAPLIVITDADGTYPNARIPDLYRVLQEESFDMVVGRRPFKKLPLLTKPAKWFITSLANYLTGEKIKDLNSGLRIFKKEIAQKYFPIISDGFSFTTTITLAMLTNGYAVKYVDIDYLKREGKSKIKPIKDTLNFIQLIIKTVMYFDPLKVFVPLSLALLLLGLAIFLIGLPFGKFYDTTFVILFVGAVQTLSIGMIADLVDKRTR
jgi:glycosyltransferase involved in cell wall biosynthesis